MDTIAAISTPRGEGGIGVVRISGPAALSIGRTLFRRRAGQLPGRPRGHTVYYGTLVDRAGETVDECLFTYFPAPHSYTAEDVVELSGHGSEVALTRALEEACGHGARLAEPGEFTRRAFLNGRLDLARAEAVMDLIRARTAGALRLAARQLEGRLSRAIRGMREALVSMLADIEAAIDFPDDVDPPATADLLKRTGAVAASTRELLATADAGRIYREGASVVILGRPNVGKSSLLNALLGHERAIVTAVPGTTRDTIEESLSIDGIPLRAVDTAGLRESCDPVEQIGVARTRAEMESADLALVVVDASEGLRAAERELLGRLAGRHLLVANKIDLGDRLDDPRADDLDPVRVSALNGEGLDRLRQAIRAHLVGEEFEPDRVLVSQLRHRQSLAASLASLEEAIRSLESGVDLPVVALDLKIAAESLGEITGETVTEATITEIFSRFCVGK